MITRQFTTAIKGAASAVSVSIGFKPRFVRVINYDTAGSLEWQAGMPAASGVKVVTANFDSTLILHVHFLKVPFVEFFSTFD